MVGFLHALLGLIPTKAQSKPRGASLHMDVVILLLKHPGFKAPAEKGGAKAIAPETSNNIETFFPFALAGKHH